MNIFWLFVATNTTFQLFAGDFDIIHGNPGQKMGHLPLKARVQHVVSLRISDSISGGGNLVSAKGIHFGDVNSLGTTHTPGVTGSQMGEVGHYEAHFTLSARRSGKGPLSLFVKRAVGGNFNPKRGIEMEDHHGVLQPLAQLAHQPVTVLSNVASGTYDKRIAINIFPTDKGELNSLLTFTLSCL